MNFNNLKFSAIFVFMSLMFVWLVFASDAFGSTSDSSHSEPSHSEPSHSESSHDEPSHSESSDSDSGHADDAVSHASEHVESVAACSEVPYGKIKVKHNKKDKSLVHMPPNPKGQVIVDLGLYIEMLTELDEVANTFKIEGFLDMVWCDPGEAFKPKKGEAQEKIYLQEQAHSKLHHIWYPDLSFANQVEAPSIENEELTILPDGTVHYEEKFSAVLEAHYDLRKFPFDKQSLEIEIESFAWNDQHLLFHMHEEKIGFSDKFHLAEWHMEGVETHLKSVKEARDRSSFHEFVMEIEVERLSGYYLWKVLIPMMILVAISWSVFMMVGDSLADRMSVSLTGILTIVAYQFVITDSLPRVTYFTFMDSVLTLSFVLMALTIIENIAVNILSLKEKEETAIKLDGFCIRFFPLVYFVSIGMLIYHFLY